MRWYLREGKTSQEQRSRFIRLPLFIVGMAVSYAFLLRAPWWTYPIVGVVWAVTYPVRMIVSRYLVVREIDRRPLSDKTTWQMAAILVAAHGFMWPISVPAGFVLANEFGMFLDIQEASS